VSRSSVALTFMLAVAAAVSWLLLGGRDEKTPYPTGAAAPEPGYYLIGASLVGLDAEGHQLYTLRAERIEQTPQDGSVSMQQVTVDYAADAQTPWTVEAQTGHISPNGDLIDLAGDVHLARAGASGADRLEIDTATLQLAVRERVARTADEISLSQGADTMSAIGLEADLSSERLRLESRVRAHFRPESS
jgi:lipopolysaccharide export system protein LptC